MDLDVEETAVKRHPIPNTVSSNVIRIPSTKSTTTLIATTTAPAPVTLPPKPLLATSEGGKRVNYNYHPIIDYFRTQQSKSFDLGNTQDWTPIVGNAEKLTKEKTP